MNPFPTLQTYSLPNGLKVILLPETHHNLVTYQIWYGVGGREEHDAIRGISHFIEHLFFKGTKSLGAGVIDRRLNEIGAMNNAATSKDYTFYYVQGLADKLEEMYRIQTEMLLEPAFDPSEVDKERLVVISEIHRALDNPDHLFYYQIMQQTYGQHVYSYPVLGYEEIIQSVHRDRIQDYFDTHYHPANMTLVLAGNMNVDQVKGWIERDFGHLQPKKDWARKGVDLVMAKAGRKLSYAKTHKNYSCLSFLGPVGNAYQDLMALDLLTTVLADSKSSRWVKQFKEQENLVESISFSCYSSREQSTLNLMAIVKDNQWVTYHQGIEDALQKLRRFYVSREELQEAKDYTLNQAAFRWQKMSDRAQSLGFHFCMNQEAMILDFEQMVQKITQEDLIRVIEKYLSFEPVVTQMLPEASSTISVPTIQTAIHKDTHSIEKLDENIHLVRFESGLEMVYLHQKEATLAQAQIYARNLAELGTRFPHGTIHMMQKMMSRGTSSMNREKIAESMDRLGAQFSTLSPDFATRRESYRSSLLVPAHNLDKAFAIYASFFTEASFPDIELQKVKESILLEIKSLPDSLPSFCMHHLMQHYFADHPFGTPHLGNAELVQELTRKDLLELYSLLYNKRNILIALGSPLPLSEAIQLVHKGLNQKLGSLDFRLGDKRVPASFTSKAFGQTLSAANPKEQAYLMLACKAPGIQDPLYHSALVLNEILGGGMSSRYFRHLRDELSLGYEVGSRFIPYADYGLMFSYLGTTPARVDEASREIRKHLQEVITHSVPQDEIDKAVRLILSRFEMGQETLSEQVSLIGSWVVRQPDLSFLKDYRSKVKAVTSSSVGKFAQESLKDIFEQRVQPA